MAYQSLYRRYRPQRFSEVRGQEHLVTALRNAVREGRVGHAYLFSGPRGTGKTTTARILAKALNCPNVTDGEPCGECDVCVAIQNGSSFDVHELDAASNNKVDDIRDLIAKAALGTPGRTKVYILDEVHMLTPAASNALLKTLEEPPEHVVFVLATTDPQKVLPTIRSRTQHFEVHLLPTTDLVALVDFVVADAGLDVDADARDYVVRAGRGSARDTLSALDQVVAAGGIPDGGEALDELIEALCERDTGRALLAVEQSLQNGIAPRTLGEELMGRLRDVFLATLQADLGRLPDRDQARVAEQARRLRAPGATRALEVLGEAFVGIQDAPDPRIALEVALVRLTKPEADTSLSALLERVERLEHAMASGGGLAAASPPAPAAARATSPDAHPVEVAPPGAEAPPAPSEVGSSPAAAGRELLRKKGPATAGADRSATPRPSKRPSAPAEAAPTTPAPPAAASARSPEPEDRAEPAKAPAVARRAERAGAAGSGELPSRDELTLAWGDHVLVALPQRAKARFGAGRWLDVDDGVAVFGLPNAIHRDRCEECRPDVEAALAEHFGQPVRVRLVVDEAPPDGPGDRPAARPSGRASGAAAVAPGRDEADDADDADDPDDVDVTELVDADVGATSIDRITDMFPGAELVEEDSSNG